MSITVIIPTYKEPDVLDLCLTSAIKGQQNQNEIIVVIDGFYDLNKNVLEKHKKYINVLDLEENVGLSRATNFGVYNASNDVVLVVNDDNVFPKNWDINLLKHYEMNSVLTPNQIEPIPSIFKQFVIENLGRDPNIFDLEKFWNFELNLSRDYKENAGNTLPFMMSKIDYLRIGGWDESYPGAWVVDWEFFMKCELSGMKMIRTYLSHFYHFVSIGTEKTPEEKLIKQQKELECHYYFEYKWGFKPRFNSLNNSHL